MQDVNYRGTKRNSILRDTVENNIRKSSMYIQSIPLQQIQLNPFYSRYCTIDEIKKKEQVE